MKTPQPSHVGCLGGPLEVALLPPLRQHPVAALRVVLRAQGAAPISGVAAPQRLPPPGGLDDFVQPEVHGLGEIPLGQDGGEAAALGCPSLRGDHRPIHLPPPRLSPWAAPLQNGPIIDTYTPPVQPPGGGPGVTAAWDSGRSQVAIASVWPSAGEGADRLPRAASGAIAVPALQTILRIDGRAQRRTGPWHQLIVACRPSYGPCRAVCLGHGTASAQGGPVAVCLQARRPGLPVGLQVHRSCLGRALRDPPGRGRVQVLPAGAEQVGLPAPRQLPKPGWLVRSCFVG